MSVALGLGVAAVVAILGKPVISHGAAQCRGLHKAAAGVHPVGEVPNRLCPSGRANTGRQQRSNGGLPRLRVGSTANVTDVTDVTDQS